MKFGENKLCTSVRLALSLGMLAASTYGTAAFAQDAQQTTTPAPAADQAKSKTLETVTVTGSLIRRVDVETASPVVTIDRAAIQATGKMTLGDLVQQLPAMTGGNVNPQTNNGGGTGASSINLRGLGSQRTLILVNGQRLLSKDPNAIPADAIERIEVLPTGASATYGSDAIGGVVNFILRKNYQGATFTANVGESDRNDGDQSGYTFTFGQTSDKGSIMAGISYSKQDGIEQGNRAFSKNALSRTANGGVVAGGSGSTPNVHIYGADGALGDFASSCASGSAILNAGANPQGGPSSYHCYTRADGYNYNTVNLIETPQERTGGFLNAAYHLTDHVSAYVNAIYQKTSSNFQLAPAVYGSASTGAKVSAGNAYNPTPGTGWSSSGNLFSTRLTGLGNRSGFFGREDAQINTGFRGDFNFAERNWSWDVGFNFGHESQTEGVTGLLNQSALYTGDSTLNADGSVTCPAGVSAVACGFNPFDANSAASIAAEKLASTTAPVTSMEIEKTWHAGLSGDLVELPAGMAQLALGYEFRRDYSSSQPDSGLVPVPGGTCALGSQCAYPVSGGYFNRDVYAETFLPLLSGMTGVQSLNLTIGDRYSKNSIAGARNNWKFALEWKPFDDLLLRGTMEDVFRAPNFTELYTSVADAPFLSSDPCDGYTGQANLALACKNVPTDGSFRNTQEGNQVSALVAGAKVAGVPIKPEYGKSYDFGFVYSPSYVPGLSTTVDLWRVNLNNQITELSLQSVLDACANGLTQFCSAIQRTASGTLAVTTTEPFVNLGNMATSGIDWSANYKLPQFSFGQINIGVNSTYLKYFTMNTAPGTAGNTTFNVAGHFLPYGSAAESACPTNSGVCLMPRWRAQGFVDYQFGGWEANWRMRYIGRFQNGGAAGSPEDTVSETTGAPAGTVLKYGAMVYNDVSIGYNLTPINTRVDFGVNNLFDKQPPLLYANMTLNANTDPSDFDLIGRYWWARVTVKF
ncbi:TonB-dependent receptor [Dyella sp. C11]|uniref:TonB-dependent receptor domain-containing protein n=1 Tax=Dyella sp. C11 TaxID=2126991 RepID=UPI000D64D896|nr:TonB-dependent receptor [Dyella sp. C11]